jgi:hypothetical protein
MRATGVIIPVEIQGHFDRRTSRSDFGFQSLAIFSAVSICSGVIDPASHLGCAALVFSETIEPFLRHPDESDD